MKKQLPAFLTGFLAAVLVLSLSLSAFAAITGKTTIEVSPISIMVKGEIFQPTDVNGNPVDVFVYRGTTYAPLRALAEAYGLEVSYDGEAKMAVVEEPEEIVEPSATPVVPGDYSDWSEEEEAAYQEFAKKWTQDGEKRWLEEQQGFEVWFVYNEVADNNALQQIDRAFFRRFAAERFDGEGTTGMFFCNGNYIVTVIAIRFENGQWKIE